MEKGNVVTLVLNLHESIDTVTELIKAMDAVRFTVGSRGNDFLRIDAFSADKCMQASERKGVKRFIS